MKKANLENELWRQEVDKQMKDKTCINCKSFYDCAGHPEEVKRCIKFEAAPTKDLTQEEVNNCVNCFNGFPTTENEHCKRKDGLFCV